MYHFTALVTCLAILFYFFTSIQVSKARTRFGIKVPATSGHPDFERVFRVQMNTLEWMPIFLPSLWLFAIYIGDLYAAMLGLIWIAGRVALSDRLFASRRQTRPGFCEFRRSPASFSGSARWARSCGGSFRDKALRAFGRRSVPVRRMLRIMAPCRHCPAPVLRR